MLIFMRARWLYSAVLLLIPLSGVVPLVYTFGSQHM